MAEDLRIYNKTYVIYCLCLLFLTKCKLLYVKTHVNTYYLVTYMLAVNF